MSERWERLDELFHAALARDRPARGEFLAEACRDDDTLRAEVESLLRNADSAEQFLESPVQDPTESLVGRQLGAYRIEALIGSGGMGDVYRARDMRLHRTVALKLLPSGLLSHDERLRRFEQEARAASALNHPNVVTIHEIGDMDGVHFIAQEFIGGQTLRQRMAQSGMSLRETLDVAKQMATALAAAHAAGVIHRDIKPENVMLRADGYVKVLDFGLAKLSVAASAAVFSSESNVGSVPTHSGMILGTIRYMSPEQARGQRVDARSDLFSLGVVLYEMIAGRPPFTGGTGSDVLAAILEREPVPVAQLASVTPALERIVGKCLRKDPEERYQSASDFLRDLESVALPSERAVPALVSSAGRGRRLAVAAVLLAVVASAVFLYQRPGPAITDQDTILLTDFVNTTGDAAFDGGTLKQGLAIQLRQTPFLNVAHDEAVRSALTMMDRSPDDSVTRPIGREICLRQGMKALVEGRIARLGTHYAVTLEAVEAQSGGVIAVEQVQAEDREHVLQALGRAATGLRRKLGESLNTLQKYDVPPEQATTSSLEALKAYSMGMQHLNSENGRAAYPLFVRAIALDSRFAAAYDWAAWACAISGCPMGPAHFAEQTFALRDRGTEREKISAVATYHHFVTADLDEENRQCEIWKQLYRNDWIPHACLAFNYLFPLGRFDDVVAEGHEIIRRSPNVAQGYRFLAPGLMHLNRFDEAAGVLDEARARHLDNIFTRAVRFETAFARHDNEGMELALAEISKHDSGRLALVWRARVATRQGRWREGRELYLRTRPPAAASSVTPPVPTIEAVQQAALLGFCRTIADEVPRMLNPRILAAWRRYTPAVTHDGSLCGDPDDAQRFVDTLVARFPRSTVARRVSLPLHRAAIALAQNRAEQAIEILRVAAPTDSGIFDVPYLRGQAYLRLGRATDATMQFRTILDHRGWQPTSLYYPLAHLGLARAAALAGDAVTARRAFEDLFAMWKDADSDLPVLVEAQKEYKRLLGRS
jgi:tetratricopeptide (TPR) repeat protein